MLSQRKARPLPRSTATSGAHWDPLRGTALRSSVCCVWRGCRDRAASPHPFRAWRRADGGCGAAVGQSLDEQLGQALPRLPASDLRGPRPVKSSAAPSAECGGRALGWADDPLLPTCFSTEIILLLVTSPAAKRLCCENCVQALSQPALPWPALLASQAGCGSQEGVWNLVI